MTSQVGDLVAEDVGGVYELDSAVSKCAPIDRGRLRRRNPQDLGQELPPRSVTIDGISCIAVQLALV